MSRDYISTAIRAQLRDVDDSRCAYCQTSEANTGQMLTFAHIIPESQDGPTIFENLCLACRRCNQYKGAATTGFDPLTGDSVPLFNPRTQHWEEHFAWNDPGDHLVGLTAIGRATIIALNMNNEAIVTARRRWISVGWHPPK